MPRAVLQVGIRYLDQNAVEEFDREMTLDEYLYQETPSSLPRLIERDYVRKEFRQWANETLARNGFNPDDINLRYAAIDVVLDPIREGGRQMSFPFMINSAFTWQGLNLHGPFVAGHQAGISMVQTLSDEVRYARFFLPKKFSGLFTSDYQTSIISNSIYGIVNNEKVDGFIAALPDRGRDPDSYVKSNIGRVLTGGHITDAARGKDSAIWPGNPLRGIPFKITREAFPHRKYPLYANDFTYYSFLRDDLHREFLRDRDFLRLIDLIRRLGPMFKAELPDLSEGLLFNPSRNIEFITGLLNRSVK